MKFPPNFLLGASTSAYQIEGATGEDGRGESVWDTFTRKRGVVEDGSNADTACDHYHRFREDVALLREARLGAYRFSIAWPRVLPDGRGAVNEPGMDFYDRLIDALLESGVEPWPCLYHWDLPQALEHRGGWPSRDTAWRFADYTIAVLARIGDRLRRLVLLNEPSTVAVQGHLLGRHAPGVESVDACLASMHHLNLATGLAAQAARAARGTIELGSALALDWLEPATDRDEDIAAATRLDELLHRCFLEAPVLGSYPDAVEERLKPWIEDGDLASCAGSFDFIGVNYFTRLSVVHRSASSLFGCSLEDPPARARTTDSGSEIWADGLRLRLQALQTAHPTLPLYVTANGAACADPPTPDGYVEDTGRIAFLESHLERCLDAMGRGVSLRGYFVWSLLDGFEWGRGFGERFGLVRVDFDTGERHPKASYRWLSELAHTRELGRRSS